MINGESSSFKSFDSYNGYDRMIVSASLDAPNTVEFDIVGSGSIRVSTETAKDIINLLNHLTAEKSNG